MPIDIGWLVENRVSYFKYMGDVTLEEVDEASRIGIDLIEQSDMPLIHTIQDGHDLVTFPKELNKLLNSVRDALAHSGFGWMLSIGVENRVIRFITTMASKLTGSRLRILSDLDEAKAFLNYIDSTLPDLSEIEPPTEDEILYRIDHTKLPNKSP